MDESLSVFYFYADTVRRHAALSATPGSAERYVLFGLDQEAARGTSVRHNLEGGQPPPGWARAAGRVASLALRRVGGTGGDLSSPLAQLRAANGSDVVVATSDRLGMPLALLARARLLRTALVYVSVGLPERLARLHGRALDFQLGALGQAASFVAYSTAEADAIRAALGPELRVPVRFVPFGVDPEYFRPDPESPRDVDIVSIGADPHRDHGLLLRVAAAHPEWRVRLVVSSEAQRALGRVPANVEVEAEIPFGTIRDRLLRARAVALPVRENSYSGGTTVLLQAMAAARPVVVSRTTAIASGYGLADGGNCRLVAPGDEVAFTAALEDLLGDDGEAEALGLRARAHVAAELTWQRYTDAMHAVLDDAVRQHSAR